VIKKLALLSLGWSIAIGGPTSARLDSAAIAATPDGETVSPWRPLDREGQAVMLNIAQAPQVKSVGQAPRARSDAQAPQAKSDGQAPQPKSDAQAPQPKSDGQAPQPKSDGQAPQPKSDGQAPQAKSSTALSPDKSLKSGAKTATNAPRPELDIVRPKSGEMFYDRPILVQVRIRNFKLQEPKNFFGKTDDQTIGHIHYTLDDFPISATAATQMMFGKGAFNKPLKSGHHVLEVELVKTNHEPLRPRVVKHIIMFTSYPRAWMQNVRKG